MIWKQKQDSKDIEEDRRLPYSMSGFKLWELKVKTTTPEVAQPDSCWGPVVTDQKPEDSNSKNQGKNEEDEEQVKIKPKEDKEELTWNSLSSLLGKWDSPLKDSEDIPKIEDFKNYLMNWSIPQRAEKKEFLKSLSELAQGWLQNKQILIDFSKSFTTEILKENDKEIVRLINQIRKNKDLLPEQKKIINSISASAKKVMNIVKNT